MHAHTAGRFGKTPEEVDKFIAEFAELSKDTKSRVSTSTVQAFKELVKRVEMSEQDLIFLSILLLHQKGAEDDKYWGRKLLDISAAAGFTEASIRLVNGALVNARTTPGVLRQASVATERGRLQKIAREGTHSRAMVLEGKIAYHLGDADTAIKWWWRAVEGAVAKSERETSQRAAGIKPEAEISVNDHDDLSSPWIELIEAHYDRSIKGMKEWDLCEKAIKIGIEQDDPTAFYYAATFYKKRDEDGQHLATSEWLYYMTKAAASGVPKAACELATFYHESGWRYIEDEPPDHIKPTPFDAYPPTKVEAESTWDRIRRMLLPRTVKQGTDMENIFHTAAWPPNPEERHRLADVWLSIAKNQGYAPAFLQSAKMCLEETLWAGARAPKEALELSPKRYLYKSKAELIDAQFSGQVKRYEVSKWAKDPPNPYYNRRVAFLCLRAVFLARVAVVRREGTLKSEAKRTKQSVLEWEDIVSDLNLKSAPQEAMWFTNSDVYDSWAKDTRAMYREALEICKKMGWQLIRDNEQQPWMAHEL